MPSLTPKQVAAASERKSLAATAEEVRRRAYLEVARQTGVSAQVVAEVVTEWLRINPPAAPEPARPGPPKPTLDTEQIREGKVGTIALHLLAIPALVRLLDDETASRASEALETTEEALTRWREVQERLGVDAKVP